MFEEESCDTNHSMDVTQLEQPHSGAGEDSINMFASVWLKVEVGSGSNESSSEVDIKPQQRCRQQKPKRKKKHYHPKRKLECDQCPYTTVYKNCLKLHVMGHQNLKPHSCTECDYTTKYPTSLQRHVLIKHEFKAKHSSAKCPALKCDQCDYETFFKWNLNAHKRKHKPDKQYRCGLCPYSTAYRHNYIKHGRVHNKQQVQFRCDKCPFVTRFAGHIHRHLAQIHNEVTERANMCDLCDFSTITRWRLNVHKQRSRQDAAIKCRHCDFETFFKCESRKHRSVHYNETYGNRVVNSYGIVDGNIEITETKDHGAGHPDEIYADATNPIVKSTDRVDALATFNVDSLSFLDNLNPLQLNQRDPSKLTDLPTDKTGSPNSSHNHNEPAANSSDFPFFGDNSNSSEDYFPKDPPDQLKSHEKSNNYLLDPEREVDWNGIQVLESDDRERPFACIECKYISKFKASVQRHYQRHHTSHDRPYKCCNCDFSTKTKDQIALHNKRSRAGSRLACAVCGYSTMFKCQLVAHQKGHYAHKCQICSYSCKHKYEMEKHFSAMHLGTGMKCRFCEFRSARKESLLCHETIHTGDKPFKCHHCEYTSARKTLLDNHLRRRHSDLKRDIRIVSEHKIQSLRVAVEAGGGRCARGSEPQPLRARSCYS